MNKHQETTILIPFHVMGGTLALLLAALYWGEILSSKVMIYYLGYLLSIFICQLYSKAENPLRNWAYIILGHFYITLPMAMLSFLAYFKGTYGYEFVLSLFIIIWLNDTGAFLVGSTIGNKKLFERISPKKSWEGFFGGLFFAMLGGYLLSYLFLDLTPLQWIVFGAIASIFATFGDLSESLLKRTMGIKDSGAILPGHGGLLDRFDSILLACPAIVIYLYLILK